MSIRRLAFILTAVVATALLPQPGVTGGPTHEYGHWFGLYHTFDSDDRPIIIGMLANSDAPNVPAGSIFRVDDVSVKVLVCLEVELSRTGQLIAYATFGPAGTQTRESDLAFVKFHLEDGVSTEADLGYSEVRTSPDRCGAAEARVQPVISVVYTVAAPHI